MSRKSKNSDHALIKALNPKDGDTKYQERLKYELEILKLKGLENYFLIVQDYVNWAKS